MAQTMVFHSSHAILAAGRAQAKLPASFMKKLPSVPMRADSRGERIDRRCPHRTRSDSSLIDFPPRHVAVRDRRQAARGRGHLPALSEMPGWNPAIDPRNDRKV
jgi:hypothetical protein